MTAGRNRTNLDRVGDRWVNLDNFYSKQQAQPSGCIEWTGVKSNIGYGFIGYRDVATGKTGLMTAHRLALMIKLDREIAPGMNANHSCHNKLCVNFQHISEGTQQQKIQDMINSGFQLGLPAGIDRGPYDHKQANRTYRYTDEEIQWVRNAPAAEIAARYGVSHERAGAMKGSFRKGYRWLPFQAVNQPRGKRPKTK